MVRFSSEANQWVEMIGGFSSKGRDVEIEHCCAVAHTQHTAGRARVLASCPMTLGARPCRQREAKQSRPLLAPCTRRRLQRRAVRSGPTIPPRIWRERARRVPRCWLRRRQIDSLRPYQLRVCERAGAGEGGWGVGGGGGTVFSIVRLCFSVCILCSIANTAMLCLYIKVCKTCLSRTPRYGCALRMKVRKSSHWQSPDRNNIAI